MRNADKPAMPATELDYDNDGNTVQTVRGGLTKREHIAAMAMQGLLASWGQHDVTAADEIASDAVVHADALLAELEKAQ